MHGVESFYGLHHAFNPKDGARRPTFSRTTCPAISCDVEQPNLAQLGQVSTGSTTSPIQRAGPMVQIYFLPALLYPLLPDLNISSYCLRQRRHDRILPSKTGCMQSNNFLTRLLYTNLYWHITYSAVSYSPIWTDFILSYIVIYFVFCTSFWDFCFNVRFAIF